jgi:hypothetical protein
MLFASKRNKVDLRIPTTVCTIRLYYILQYLLSEYGCRGTKRKKGNLFQRSVPARMQIDYAVSKSVGLNYT